VIAGTSSGAANFFSTAYDNLARSIGYLKSRLLGAPAAPGLVLTPTVSGCYYSGGQSLATVSVEVAWTMIADGETINVTLGSTTRTIVPNSTSNPPIVTPQVVAFEVPADSASRTVTATLASDPSVTASVNVQSPPPCAPLVCAANDLGGTVFNDYNADGIKQAGETSGVSGVTVTAYDRTGTSYTTATNASGRYCLTIPVANYPVRVEFTNIPAEFAGGFTTPQGTDNRTSVQFVSSPDATVDLGVNNPIDFCQANPKVMTPCYVFGDPLATTGTPANDTANEAAIVRFDYNLDGVETGEDAFATAGEVGSLWALAYKKQTRHLFGVATVRRHTGLGPQGIGGIYVMNPFGSTVTGNVIDAWSVETQLGVDVDDPASPFGGSTNPATSNANRGLSPDKTSPSQDAQAFSAVGKLGIGDIDISDDGNSLWFVNQYDKKLYAVDIANYNPANTATRPTAANISSYAIPNSGCVGGEWRPAGTKFRRGVVYVGGVCDASASQNLSDMRASVQAYNIAGNTWSEIFNFPLTYPKGSSGSGSSEKGWHPWSDDWDVVRNGSTGNIFYSVPMFTDIEFDVDGTMVLGFNDRTGMQTGRANYSPLAASGSFTGFAGGDALRAFFSNGTFVLENNAKSGPVTGYAPNNNQGPGFGEFYEDNWRTTGHTETIVGGLAIRPGSGEVVATSMDPHDSSIWAAGVRYMSNFTGLRTHAFAVYSDSNDTPSNEVGKSTGVGDVELTCQTINYLELGNRIWRDDNRNGIQDPQEPPIPGVTVRLKDSGNNVIASAVTNASGEYYFSNGPGSDTASAKYNLGGFGSDGIPNTGDDTPGLKPSAGATINTYRICLDAAADYAVGGALYGLKLTTANAPQPANGNAADSSNNALTDVADSDATLPIPGNLPGAGNAPIITVTTGDFGSNNHGLDFGMWGYDLGDAPDPTFPTLLASNGARHVLVNGVWLGSSVDAEHDGFPTADHTGDDANGTPDDEDGVTIPTLNAGQSATIAVNASVAGFLNAWIDFNNDGDWNDAGEQIFSDQALAAGNNNLLLNVPVSAVSGTVCTRWRFVQASDGPSAVDAPTGETMSGEVEDHPAVIRQLDFGDAPDPSFPTLLANDGARHVIVSGVHLGAGVDQEGDGQQTASHDGDDASGDDEDGVTIPTLVAGNASTITVVASASGILNAWIDFNNDGDWNDAGEQIVTDQPVNGGSNTINITVPANPFGASQATVCTRWRFVRAADGAGAVNSPTGEAPSGEVEDHPALILKAVSIGNQVFYDTNNDGDKDPGENGINGVVVELYADGDMNGAPDTAFPLDRRTTATANGHAGLYLFTQQTLDTSTGSPLGTPSNLTPGKYVVCIPASNFTGAGALVGLWSSGTTAAAAGASTESPAPDPNTGGASANPGIDNDDNGFLQPGGKVLSGTIDAANNEPLGEDPDNDPSTPDSVENLTIDFGFYGLSIGNLVFHDGVAGAEYNNATFDAGETGLAGVTVRLLAEDGSTVLSSKMTDANGKYLYAGLAAGKYFVEVDRSSAALTGFASSKDGANAGNPNAADGDDNGPLASITAAAVRSPQIMLVAGDATATGESDQAQSASPGFGDPAAVDNPATPDANSNLKIDFGFVRVYSLGNRGWKDNDNSGTLNGGEAGVDGVAIRLLAYPSLTQAVDVNGGTVADQTTSGGGYYRFDNLAAGDYVVEVMASNFSGAGALVGCVTSTGAPGISGSTGPYESAPDPDSNAADSDDNGSQSGSAVRSAPVTFGDGTGAQEPSGEADPSPNPQTGEAPDNQSNRTVDFGFTPLMNLGNLVWKDYDNDGIRDTSNPNEPGVANVKVVLYADTDASGDYNPPADQMVAMTTTQSDGAYGFSDVLPGNYFAVVDASNFAGAGALAGCLSSTGSVGGNSDQDNNDHGADSSNPSASGVATGLMTMQGNAEPSNDGDGPNGNLTIDFGFIYANMRIGDLVWKDKNKDGARQPGEPGIANVKVLLFRDVDRNGTFNLPADAMVGMTTTDQNGNYQFTDLIPDPYFVRVDASNFNPSGPLYGCASSYGSVIGNSDQDDRDHGSDSTGPALSPPTSSVTTLVSLNEPPAGGDGDDNDGNRTVDFGFATLLEASIVTQQQACIKPGDPITLQATITNLGPSEQNNNPGPEYSVALPPQLVGIPGSCTTSGGTTASCTVTGTQVAWDGAIQPGQSVSLGFRVQVANATPSGTQLCMTSIASFDSDNDGTNETSVSFASCEQVTCQPVGPGTPPADGPGCSVLIYPVFTSNSASPAAQNTRITLTNIDPTRSSAVHLFFVDGTTCSVADAYLCLTASQTTSFYASDLDPGTTGYVVAVAVDPVTGCPVDFNCLIGDQYVKFSSGHATSLRAEGVKAIAGGLPVCDANSTTAQMNFDGVSYSRLPRAVALSNVPARADGNDTMLILNRISGNLGTGMDRLGSVFGLLYDDAENAFSFSFNPNSCQFRSSISNSFPRTTPRIEQVIPAGRSGWMKLWSVSDAAIVGAAINYNPNSLAGSNAFNQGHSLHALTFTSSATLTIPVFPPNCN
jgi:hypothetical protein